MKLKYEAAKNSRYKTGGMRGRYKRINGAGKKYRYRRAFIQCDPSYDNKIGYWWIKLEGRPGRWVPGEELWMDDGRMVDTFEGSKVTGASSSACVRIRSIKAFRRRLKQWGDYLPKGTKFTLVGRLIGTSVYGKI